jgi:hypothetical protein
MLTEKKIRRLRDIMTITVENACTCKNCQNGILATKACLSFIAAILGELPGGIAAIEHDEKNYIKMGWLKPEPRDDDYREIPSRPARM